MANYDFDSVPRTNIGLSYMVAYLEDRGTTADCDWFGDLLASTPDIQRTDGQTRTDLKTISTAFLDRFFPDRARTTTGKTAKQIALEQLARVRAAKATEYN